MMLSSSQVLDHQLIFHIMYGLGQFHHRQNKGEERRGEGRFGKKNQQLLSKHSAAADGKRKDNKSWEIWQKKSNNSHLGVASSKTSSRSSKRRSSRSSKRRSSRSSKSSGVVVRVVV